MSMSTGTRQKNNQIYTHKRSKASFSPVRSSSSPPDCHVSLFFFSLLHTHTQEKEKSIFGEGWEGISLDFQYFPLCEFWFQDVQAQFEDVGGFSRIT